MKLVIRKAFQILNFIKKNVFVKIIFQNVNLDSDLNSSSGSATNLLYNAGKSLDFDKFLIFHV